MSQAAMRPLAIVIPCTILLSWLLGLLPIVLLLTAPGEVTLFPGTPGASTQSGGLIGWSNVPGVYAMIWVISPLADVVFVVGTSVVAFLSYALARKSLPRALLVGIAGQAVVHAASAAALDAGKDFSIHGAWLAAIAWGFLGWSAAGAMPPLVARRAQPLVEFEIVEGTGA